MSEHSPWKLRVSQTAKHMGGRRQLWHTKRGRLASFTSGGDEYACEEVLAKLNAFHDPAGRTIATEDIAEGTFWKVYRFMEWVAWQPCTCADDSGCMSCQASDLLSSLKVQGPET